MREKFRISDEVEVRLWNKNTGGKKTSRLLDKREQTLMGARIYSGNRVYIETRNKDGSWPRGVRGEG